MAFHKLLKLHKLWMSISLTALLGGGGFQIVGCAEPPSSYAVESNLKLTARERNQKLILTPADRERVRSVLDSVAGDHPPVGSPFMAEGPVRWSDIANALYYACNEVEMAVTRTIEEENSMTFHLKTVNDRPGRLHIRRVEDDRVYTAEAVVGRFEDDDELACRLIAAFDRQMRLFGAKRSLADGRD